MTDTAAPPGNPEPPPAGGKVPDVVATWDARSQLSWFRRFIGRRARLAPVSTDPPVDVGELSRHMIREAIDLVDRELADAPADVRRAVAVIRMVADIPRRAPWYGVPMDPDDSSVTVGVVLRNAFEALGDYIDYPTDRGLETEAGHWFTQRELPRWREGKREYDDYLDHLFDPIRADRERAEARLSADQAAAGRAWLAGETFRPRG